jgi:hypothetical protein
VKKLQNKDNDQAQEFFSSSDQIPCIFSASVGPEIYNRDYDISGEIKAFVFLI